MATKTGYIYAGSAVASGYKFNTPRTTNITMSGTEYPSGSVSISGGAWYLGYGSTGTTYSYDLYLCDSNGNNSVKIGTLSIKGQSTTNGVTFSSNISQSSLAGKELYLKVTGNNADNLTFMNTMSITVNTANSYSASTFSASDVNFGASSKVTFSNQNISELRHTVTWTVGNETHTKTSSTGDNSISWTIDPNWMPAATPNSTYATLTITVTTLKGSTQIGQTASREYKAKVPEGVVPSMGAPTVAVLSPVSGFPGTYIRGITGVTITLNNVTPASGTTISSYTLSCSQSETYTRSGYVFTIPTLRHSGNILFSLYITDSRGRKSPTQSYTINVLDYSAPTISSTGVYRCLNDAVGTPDENGTYASIMCNASCADIAGNTLTIDSYYYLESAPSQHITAQNNMTPGESYIIGGGNLDPNYTYHVVFTATDAIGGTKTKDVKIDTVSYSIHVKSGGNGVAFGKTSEVANSVEIAPDWDLYYKGNAIDGIISKDARIYKAESTTHTFVVPSNSRNFVILTSSSATRTWIGYVYSTSAGAVTLMEMIKGSNTTASSDTNSMSFTFNTSAAVYMRVLSITGDIPYVAST